jgi:hypothetical protein
MESMTCFSILPTYISSDVMMVVKRVYVAGCAFNDVRRKSDIFEYDKVPNWRIETRHSE